MNIGKNENRKMNMDYALIQGLYWCAYGAVGSYAAFYLQSLGFSGTVTGTVMALACTLAFFLPMVLSPIIDEGRKLTSTGALLGIIAVQLAAGSAVLCFTRAGIIPGIIFIIWMGLMWALLPLCTEVCVDAEHCGYRMEYSTGRAFGSFSYVVTSLTLGKLLETSPYTVITKLALFALVLLAAAVFAAGRSLGKQRAKIAGDRTSEADAKRGSDTAEAAERPRRGKSIPAFLKQYRDFGLLLLGLGLVLTGDGAVAVFLINIVEDLGGTAADMGYINASYAALEILAMLFWRRISKKHGDTVLALSICFFVGKTLFFALVRSIPAIYPGVILHFAGYGLYTPAIVAYTIKKIPYEDSAKAQSLAASMGTLGVILSSISCGILIDRISVRKTMLLFACVGAAGAILCITAIIKMRKQKR
ncbi:MAG: MFS transporter [Lachnospiraceae bacterium]|nr:MFS transporter [Candidatus Hippenecus merdae]